MTTTRLFLLCLLPLSACGPAEGGNPGADPGDDPGADTGADTDADTDAENGGDTGPADSSADSDPGEAPTLLSSTPAHGDVGVRAETTIVLVFSEAMDPASVEAALVRSEPGLSPGWDAGHTTLTLTPVSPLAYAEGRGTDPSQVDALSYTVEIGTGATSAQGVPLAEPVILRFQTLKRMFSTAVPDPELTGQLYGGDYDRAPPADELRVGDLSSDVGIRSFVSFDLSGLPADVVELEEATWVSRIVDVYGDADTLGPYTEAAHLVFSALDDETYWSRVDADLGMHATSTDEEVFTDVSAVVRADLAERATRGDRAQFRLAFPEPSNGDHGTDYYAYGMDMELGLTWLVP